MVPVEVDSGLYHITRRISSGCKEGNMLTDKSCWTSGFVTTLLRVPQLPYLYVMPACVVEDNEGRWGVAGHPLGRNEAEVAQGIVAELWRGPNSTEMLWFLKL